MNEHDKDERDKTGRPYGAADDAIAHRLLRVVKPRPDPDREAALLDRIVAAAERSPHLVSAGRPSAAASAVPKPAVRMVATARDRVVPLAPRRAAGRASAEMWGAGAILAASLLIGIVLGHTPLPHAAAASVVDATGVALSSTQDIAFALASAEGEDDDQ